MPRFRPTALAVSLLIGISCTLLWWHFADRWTYYDAGSGKMQPKFPLPGWWLAAESAFVGLLSGAVTAAACVYVPRLIRFAKGT